MPSTPRRSASTASQSLDAAISEAQRRLAAAQRDEQTKEARDNAGAAG
jgi:hypothetical protein